MMLKYFSYLQEVFLLENIIEGMHDAIKTYVLSSFCIFELLHLSLTNIIIKIVLMYLCKGPKSVSTTPLASIWNAMKSYENVDVMHEVFKMI